MNQVQAIAIVMAVMQFFKKVLPTIIKDMVASVLTVILSVIVVVFKYVSEGLPLNFGAITFLVEVIVGAMGGYGLLKVAGGAANGPS
jgi:uncharacterized membrane protein